MTATCRILDLTMTSSGATLARCVCMSGVSGCGKHLRLRVDALRVYDCEWSVSDSAEVVRTGCPRHLLSTRAKEEREEAEWS